MSPRARASFSKYFFNIRLHYFDMVPPLRGTWFFGRKSCSVGILWRGTEYDSAQYRRKESGELIGSSQPGSPKN
jgi:hypothetical protein